VTAVRYILPILGLLALIGGLAGLKFAQIGTLMKAGEAFAKAGPPPETVSSDVARELTWEGTIRAIGSIAAVRGVAISNESPGVVKRILFDSGNLAKPGQVLVELDTSVEQAQLQTAQARRDLAQQTLTRTRALITGKAVAASQLENDEAQLKSATAEVASLEAQIARKIVRAPFAGRLGIREVNLGQYLSPGTELTTLEALDSVFVDFTLPQQALGAIRPGQPVRVSLEAEAGVSVDGTITAVDPSIDPVTRSIRARASVPNKEQKFRPGMFANVRVVLPKGDSIIAVPQTAVVHAPYGDSVFLVEPLPAAADAHTAGKPESGPAVPEVKQVVQQFVRLGEERGDFVAIVEGVKPGQEIVSAGAFKLRNGAKVVIDNSVKPEAQLSPQPVNH
jgi:membrane fusion protein (multidrug efflux system)